MHCVRRLFTITVTLQVATRYGRNRFSSFQCLEKGGERERKLEAEKLKQIARSGVKTGHIVGNDFGLPILKPLPIGASLKAFCSHVGLNERKGKLLLLFEFVLLLIFVKLRRSRRLRWSHVPRS